MPIQTFPSSVQNSPPERLQIVSGRIIPFNPQRRNTLFPMTSIQSPSGYAKNEKPGMVAYRTSSFKRPKLQNHNFSALEGLNGIATNKKVKPICTCFQVQGVLLMYETPSFGIYALLEPSILVSAVNFSFMLTAHNAFLQHISTSIPHVKLHSIHFDRFNQC